MRSNSYACRATIRDERVEHARDLQELDEDRRLPERRQRRVVVPLDLDPPGPAVDRYGPSRCPRWHPGRNRSAISCGLGILTRQVSGNWGRFV